MILPLTAYQEATLHRLYYDDKFLVGINKLYHLAQQFPTPPSRSQVADWLKRQEVYQLHYHPRRTGTIKSIVAKNPGKIFQADLIDFNRRPDGLYRYILVMIDAFSRKIYLKPLKDKTAQSIAKGIETIYEENKLEGMRLIQTDNEFDTNNLVEFFEAKGIKHLTGIARRPQSQGIVERANGMIKNLISRNQTLTGKKRWVSDLPVVERVYNATLNKTTKFAPDDAEYNREEVAANIKVQAHKHAPTDKDDIRTGDRVRLRVFKGTLDKFSDQTFTKEIYTVVRVRKSSKPYLRTTYRVMNDEGEIKKNSYTRSDMQPIPDEFTLTTDVVPAPIVRTSQRRLRPRPKKQKKKGLIRNPNADTSPIEQPPELMDEEPPVEIDPESFEVESVVAKKKIKGDLYYEVKWVGWDEKFNWLLPFKDFSPEWKKWIVTNRNKLPASKRTLEMNYMSEQDMKEKTGQA